MYTEEAGNSIGLIYLFLSNSRNRAGFRPLLLRPYRSSQRSFQLPRGVEDHCAVLLTQDSVKALWQKSNTAGKCEVTFKIVRKDLTNTLGSSIRSDGEAGIRVNDVKKFRNALSDEE
jgi:hypothetical protein